MAVRIRGIYFFQLPSKEKREKEGEILRE